MNQKYDLCAGRDARGRVWYTRLPAGVARTGMYVRLIGGVFLRLERVETSGHAMQPMCTAAQLLESVWEGRGNG